MRTFTQFIVNSWSFGVVIVVAVLTFISPVASVQVVFFDQKNYEGNSLTLTITGGCYKFKKKWLGRAESVQVERDGCIVAWKHSDCTGQSIQVLPHSHDSNDLHVFGFDHKVSSVSLCHEISYRTHDDPKENPNSGDSVSQADRDNAKKKVEVNFFDQPDFNGNIFTLTLYTQGECYNFKSKWSNKIASIEAQGACLRVWDTYDCDGGFFNLNPSNTSPEEFRNLKRVRLDNRIKSIRLCPQQPSSSSTSSSSSSGTEPFPSDDDDNSSDGGGSGFGGGSSSSNEDTGSYRSNNDSVRKDEPQSTPSKSPKGGSSFSSNNDVIDVAVKEHNKYRRMHGVNELVWDESLQNIAQSYADYLANNNKFQHSKDHYDLGENLAGTTTTKKVDALLEVIHLWYNEIHHYDFQDPGHSVTGIQAGHFTQMVWKSTTNFGLGMAWNPRRSWWVVVANYSPGGNFKGEYKENVFPPNN